MLTRLEDMTEKELRELMNALGTQIEAVAAVFKIEKPMFCLLLFNDPKLGQYICNCERADTIKVLRETADRLERREDVPR